MSKMYYQRSRRGRNNRDESRSKRTQSVDLKEKIGSGGSEKRLSNAEIDQVLHDIRSRSSSRPPPPKATPPPLPTEFENPKSPPTKQDDKDKVDLRNEEIEAVSRSHLFSDGGTACDDGKSDNSGSNWTENPAYCAPKRKVKINLTIQESPKTVRRKKYKINVKSNDDCENVKKTDTDANLKKSQSDENVVDAETAKLVENLKERLKTFDEDLDRVKKAALKIHHDLNQSSLNKSAV